MPRMSATILLCDNGSRRPEATHSLRALAHRLAQACGHAIHPVSLQHADAIPVEALDGIPAHTLPGFLAAHLAEERRDFLILPLFFGPSRAITRFIPQTVEALRQTHGEFSLRVAQELCPLPEGEPRLADVLAAHTLAARAGESPDYAILVDHGSPLPAVTAVRHWLYAQVRSRLSDISWREAVMERRADAAYDFNGEVLEHTLTDIAAQRPDARISLTLLFLHPGRHAGPGGDIEGICAAVGKQYPMLDIAISPLVSAHPLLTDILAHRLQDAR